MSFRQFIAIKAYEALSGKKGVDVKASTPRGNYFMTLDNAQLDQFMQAIWGSYSKSSLITLYHTVGEIFAPVHEIADRVSGAMFQLKTVSNDEVVYDNKFINRLLDTPNPLQTFRELVYEAVAYNLVAGENYLYANVADTLRFDYKNVATLINLPADAVTIRQHQTMKLLSATTMGDLIKSYDVQYGTGITQILPEKVLFTKVTSLYANDLKIVGRSPLLSADKNVCNLAAVYAARNTVYTKRGMLGMFVSQISDQGGMVALTPGEKEQVVKDMDAKYGLDGTKSPYAVTSFPLKWERVAMTIAELEPFKETQADAAVIYGVYKVPRELMPSSDDGATYENRREAEKIFYRSVIIPAAEKYTQSLSSFLRLQEYGLYLSVSFDHIELLQENKKDKAATDWQNNETYRLQFANGIITLNDWRVAVGYEKVANALYDKLIFDMSDDELGKVMEIIKITKGSSNANGSQQQNDGGAGK